MLPNDKTKRSTNNRTLSFGEGRMRLNISKKIVMRITELRDKCDDKDGSMYGKKNIEDSMAMLYHENSKLTTHSTRVLGENIGAFSNPFVLERSSQPFKCYPGRETIDLSIYGQHNSSNHFFDVITQRRSVRDFDKTYKLSLNELSLLLHNAYGVTYKSKIEGLTSEGHMGMRNIPAAGGLYPLEIYIVLFNAHIPAGFYHSRPHQNCLEKIKEGHFIPNLSGLIQTEPYINMNDCAGLIIITGMIERLFIKYRDRGYRFLMQESGALGLMLSLIAESIKLGSCVLGGYNDDQVNDFLGIDGVFETINNVMVIGKPTHA